MKCTECNGRGVATYYVETHRDENRVTMSAREDICHTCNGSGKKIMTNADCIRSMSDREMASFFADKVIDASLNALGSESEKLTATQIEYEKTRVMYHILQELRTPVKEYE